MDDHVARLHEGQQQGRDGRHAGGEGERVLRILPQAEAILEDFLVGPVEARIDQPSAPPGRLPVTPSKKRLPAAALSNTKVEVRKIGGFSEPSDRAGSKPWPIIRVEGAVIAPSSTARGSAREVGFVFHL
jgi:hypothetical protein